MQALLRNSLKAQSHYFHRVPITACLWRVTAAIGTFWCDDDDLLTLAPIRLPAGPGLIWPHDALSVLLLDEPLANLDSLTRIAMQAELMALWQRERFTAFLVTHDVEEALYLARRVLVLSHRPARILADIAIDLPYPRHRSSARFTDLRRGRGESSGEAADGGGTVVGLRASLWPATCVRSIGPSVLGITTMSFSCAQV